MFIIENNILTTVTKQIQEKRTSSQQHQKRFTLNNSRDEHQNADKVQKLPNVIKRRSNDM